MRTCEICRRDGNFVLIGDNLYYCSRCDTQYRWEANSYRWAIDVNESWVAALRNYWNETGEPHGQNATNSKETLKHRDKFLNWTCWKATQGLRLPTGQVLKDTVALEDRYYVKTKRETAETTTVSEFMSKHDDPALQTVIDMMKKFNITKITIEKKKD